MQFSKPQAKSELEKVFLDAIERDTPSKVKNHTLIDLNNKEAFTFTLKKEHLDAFNEETDALGILSWFNKYREEAKVSTAGIRGLQNPLYPWDTRYPLNLIGVMLATIGKVLVAQETGKSVAKVAGCEVRYNSAQYVELISRIQAAYGIKTYVTKDYETLSIFMISFVIFINDFYGGEYVTSSHAMSKKIATKDLNAQGSQYIPSESLLFVNKVEQILNEVREKGEYTIRIAASDDPNIDTTFLNSIQNGVADYVPYLRQGTATSVNIDLIQNLNKKVVIDTVGGSFKNTMDPVLHALEIQDKFDYIHSEEDPFNHGVGKEIGADGELFDWSCDPIILKVDLQTMKIKTPVVNTVDYTQALKDYPIGTILLITDPDADRLITAQIDSTANLEKIQKLGIVTAALDGERILVLYTPNQSFLMNMDFQQKALEKAGLWDKYNWFMIKTTASQKSWDQWAFAHNIPVVNTPVGFKEIADVMINVEKKLTIANGEDIHIKDVFGNDINLGKKPRLLFGGEESGGEIYGTPELITSKAGRQAVSMREKSAGEAVIITAAMLGWLEKQNMSLTDYLVQIFEDSKINSRYEIRIDQKYYNESEPDIEKLLKEKEKGMHIKTLNNSYFLSLALGYKDKIINLDQVKEILHECFPDLDFSDLQNIQFCGDGTYIEFSNKFLEIRPSGTDAVNKGYSFGKDQWESVKYAQAFALYPGERTPLHSKYIPQEFYAKIEQYGFEVYSHYKMNQ